MENGFLCTEVTRLTWQDTRSHTSLELNKADYFGFVPHLINTNVESCQKECLTNCSCNAALFQRHGNLSIGNCSLLTELYSLRNSAEGEFNSLTCIKVQIPSDKNKLSLPLVLSLALSIPAAFLVFAYCFCMRWRKKESVHEKMGKGDDSTDKRNFIMKRFSI